MKKSYSLKSELIVDRKKQKATDVKEEIRALKDESDDYEKYLFKENFSKYLKFVEIKGLYEQLKRNKDLDKEYVEKMLALFAAELSSPKSYRKSPRNITGSPRQFEFYSDISKKGTLFDGSSALKPFLSYNSGQSIKDMTMKNTSRLLEVPEKNEKEIIYDLLADSKYFTKEERERAYAILKKNNELKSRHKQELHKILKKHPDYQEKLAHLLIDKTVLKGEMYELLDDSKYFDSSERDKALAILSKKEDLSAKDKKILHSILRKHPNYSPTLANFLGQSKENSLKNRVFELVEDKKYISEDEKQRVHSLMNKSGEISLREKREIHAILKKNPKYDKQLEDLLFNYSKVDREAIKGLLRDQQYFSQNEIDQANEILARTMKSEDIQRLEAILSKHPEYSKTLLGNSEKSEIYDLLANNSEIPEEDKQRIYEILNKNSALTPEDKRLIHSILSKTPTVNRQHARILEKLSGNPPARLSLSPLKEKLKLPIGEKIEYPDELTHELFCEIYNQLKPRVKRELEQFIEQAQSFRDDDQDRSKRAFYTVNDLPPAVKEDFIGILKKYNFNDQQVASTLKLLENVQKTSKDYLRRIRNKKKVQKPIDALPKIDNAMKLKFQGLEKELQEREFGFLSLENMKLYAYKLRFFYYYEVVKKFYAPKPDFNKGLELKMLSERREETKRRRAVVSKIILGSL